MDASPSFDLFLSYAPADRAWVHGYLIPALGVPRERIITPDDFRLGAARVNEIERAVTTSRYSVLVLSATYLADEWATFGEQLAAHLTTAEQAVRLIPLLKSDCELPLRIDFRVRLDCVNPADWERETARLRDLLNQPAPQPEQIECPYPGMIPFRVEDARWFYGRAKEIDELVRRIRVQNFLFVIGPSGSGKSSLVFAGLVAELHKRRPNAWHVQTMRPGSNPLTALNDSTIALSHHRTNALIIIDQLEELFTQSDKPTQAAFIARLKSLRAENRCTIVVTMRADFYPDLMNSDLWPLDPSERVEIAPLRGASLAEAIGKPADQVGVYLEAGLVERLLADAADEPGVLPLVQETMVLLWDKRERRLLPLRAYEELGQGNLSGLAVAIATRADAVFARLDESQRNIARRVFLRLVQFGEGRADTRRQQRVSALRAAGDEPNEFDRTLKHLTDHRLLTLTGEEKDADRQADIAHEALIAGWQRFRQWVNERREAEQTRRRLEDEAREWERLGRGSAGLLDDVELREAENWLKSADATDLGYSETLPELIDISRAEIQQAEHEKEETRRRELAQAKALADEQRRRAESERRSRVRQRYFTIGLAGFLVIAIVAAGFALNQYSYANQQFGIANQQRFAAQTQEAIANQQRGEAQSQTKLATSRELAASAIVNLNTDPELATLLALQADYAMHTYESEDALRQAIHASPLATLRGHSDGVTQAAWSPDGKQIVTASDDRTARVWDAATGHELATLRGHTSGVKSAAWSPDGKQIVTASWDNTARVWDAASGRELATLRGHRANVNSAAWSPNGKQIVTAGFDQTARVWDAASGHELATLTASRSPYVFSAAWSPDGKQIVTVAGDNTPRIWDATSGRELTTLRGHMGEVHSAVWNSDGKQIVTTGNDQTARVWDAANGRELATLREHTDHVVSAVWSPDGKQIVTASLDNTARVWDATSGRALAVLRGHTGGVKSATWSPDGKQIVTASNDRTARVWDVASGHELATLHGHTGGVKSATWSPDGKQIITVGSDRTARVSDAASGRELATLRGHTVRVASAAWSPDGKQIVTLSGDQTARVWDAARGRELATLRGLEGPVISAVWSPDGKRIVTASRNSKPRIWDAASGRELITLRGLMGAITDVAWSPDSKQIVGTSAEGTACIWDAAGGRLLHYMQYGYTDPITSVAWSPDGKQIVTANDGRTALVWDATSGRGVTFLRGHTDYVMSAAWSPDGKQIVTASDDRTARVWDVASGRELATLRGHTDRVTSALWSPDGKQIVTVSYDNTARVWDAASERELATLRGHTDKVTNAAWSPDGKQIVTASWDQTARVWGAASGRELATLRGHTDKVTNAAWSPDGKQIVTASYDNTARIYLTHIEDLIALAKSRLSRELTCEERERYLHEPRCPTPTPTRTPTSVPTRTLTPKP